MTHAVPRISRRAAAVLACTVALAACAPGSGEGLNVSGRPLDESGDVPLAATLQSIQVNVFDASCTICHAGAAAPLGLQLDAGNSFTNLVGVPSVQAGSLLRVDPGDPAGNDDIITIKAQDQVNRVVRQKQFLRFFRCFSPAPETPVS